MRNYLISLVLLVGIFAPPPPTTVGRFLYVVSCDARIDKLDTTVGRKVDAYDLAKRTGKEQLIPVVHGPLDGCLSYQALFDVQASVFYTAVPLADQPKPDGTKDYRVLAFSVPGLQLVKRMSGGESLDAPPHLRLDTGVVKIFKASEWSPQSDLDLSAYAPGKTQVPNQVLESSGEKVLLRIFTARASELVLAVADLKLQTLVRLQGVPSTVAPSVHLAPGGAYVLVEETGGTGSEPAKTGKLALFDATTGTQVREFSAPHIKDLYFLAISPTGKAIYHSNDRYWFLDLGKEFAADAVTRPISTSYPPFFFADK